MKTALLNVQGALYNTLVNDVDLNNAITGVFDEVPSGTNYPYVTLGEDTVTPNDTKTGTGEQITHTLHIWSEYSGKTEAKKIINLVLAALNNGITLNDGSSVEILNREYMNVIADPSGLYHGIIRLRFTIKH